MYKSVNIWLIYVYTKLNNINSDNAMVTNFSYLFFKSCRIVMNSFMKQANILAHNDN